MYIYTERLTYVCIYKHRMAIDTFKLPRTEQCLYIGQMVETFYRGKRGLRRLLFMSTVLILEPTLHGTDTLDAIAEEVRAVPC